jgi:hypothetical protein
MIENIENGVCNFINPGSINLSEILKIYNNYTHHEYNVIDVPINSSRSFARLESNKLSKYNPLDIKIAIDECCKKSLINNNS